MKKEEPDWHEAWQVPPFDRDRADEAWLLLSEFDWNSFRFSATRVANGGGFRTGFHL